MESCCDGTLSIIKAKCTWIICEEMNKTVNNNVAWLSRGIIQVAFYDYVFTSLNFSFTTWAAGWEVGKESLSIFSNGACPVVMRVNQVHSESVNPMKGSYDPPLAYIGLMTCCFSSSKLKKHWPFLGLSTKDSCHSWRMLSHSFFLLNKCDSLLEKAGMHLLALTWSSTS